MNSTRRLGSSVAREESNLFHVRLLLVWQKNAPLVFPVAFHRLLREDIDRISPQDRHGPCLF